MRGRQPYSQEVGPVPKCKAGIAAAIVASGMFAATAVAATIDGDNGPNRLTGTPEADVIQALGGNDRVWARGGDDHVATVMNGGYHRNCVRSECGA